MAIQRTFFSTVALVTGTVAAAVAAAFLTATLWGDQVVAVVFAVVVGTISLTFILPALDTETETKHATMRAVGAIIFFAVYALSYVVISI